MILDKFRLNDRVALVTGASAGLGAAIAVALAEAGAHVVAHGHPRAPHATCELVERAGCRGLAGRGDPADREMPPALVEPTLGEVGRLDILLTKAGTLPPAPP